MIRLETFFLGLFAAGVLVGFVACAQVEFGSTAIYNERNYEKIVPPKMVDILVVVDNSSSMLEEQGKLKSGFGGFTRYLNSSGFNYKVGVVTTFLDPNNSSANHNIRTGNFNTIIEEIKEDTKLCPQGSFSCPAEDRQRRNMYGKEKGIDRAIAAIKGNTNFFRNEAELVVIFVSDEDSGCETENYDNFECEQYFSDHKNADDLINAVKSRFSNDKHFTAHSIVDTRSISNCTPPPSTNNEPSPLPISSKLYIEASDKTDGINACIYTGDYKDILRNIAEDISIHSIQLGCVPFEKAEDEKCFRLSVPADYDSDMGYPHVEGSKLVLSPPLTSGELISLQYWCTNYQHTSLPDLENPCEEGLVTE